MKKNFWTLYSNNKKNIWMTIILAWQNVFAMMSATFLMPTMVNNSVGQCIIPISLALFTAGLGTIIYQKITKSKSPVFLGSSFAYIAAATVSYSIGGPGAIFVGAMEAGLVYMFIAVVVKIIGISWIQKLLPAYIIGPVIIVMGLSLAPSAIKQIGLDGTSVLDVKSIIVAIVTVLVTIICMVKGKGIFNKIPFIIGIATGYILSIALGMTDFSVITNANWFEIPSFKLPFISFEISKLTILGGLPMAFCTLVSIPEHLGDHACVSTIIGRDLYKNPGLFSTLLGDGIATFVAGLFGSVPNTSYGENTAILVATKWYSILPYRVGALFVIGLSFFGKGMAILQSIPAPVLGGISLLLYGLIAFNGVKVISDRVKVDLEDSKVISIISIILVIGLGGAVVSISIGNTILSFSGMVLSAVVGILINSILSIGKNKNKNRTINE